MEFTVRNCVFAQCKDRMRAVKRALKHLGEPDPEQSEKEQLAHTRECLLNIGNHIGEVLAEFNDPEKIKEWRRCISFDYISYNVTSSLLSISRS